MTPRKPNRPLRPPEPGTEPAPPYDLHYLEGLRLFDEGCFWHAHEALETLWMEEEGGPMLFYQGLIQFCAACHILTRAPIRWGGAGRNLDKAVPKLELYEPRYMGLDVTFLVRTARDLRARIARAEGANDATAAFGELTFFALWPIDAQFPRPPAGSAPLVELEEKGEPR